MNSPAGPISPVGLARPLPTEPLMSTTVENDVAMIEKLRAAHQRLQAGNRQGHHRPGAGARSAPDGDLLPQPRPAHGRAGAGQDAHGPHAGPGPRPDLQAHPVHARPDAVGHHRQRGHPGRPGHARADVQVPPRADLRQHRAGRRDQPHAAEDPGRAARSHAGAQGVHRRRRPPDEEPVLRPGDAEPDRAGRHLPAARGAARPLPVPHQGRLPVRRGGRADHADRHVGRRR